MKNKVLRAIGWWLMNVPIEECSWIELKVPDAIQAAFSAVDEKVYDFGVIIYNAGCDKP